MKTKKEKYRWKFNKDPIVCRHVNYETKDIYDNHMEVNYWEVATGGDFRKGYITFTNDEFENLFERY